MRKTVGSLRESLRIDPKVIPAKDPTNLQFDPGPLQPDLYVRAAQLMESRGQLDEAQGQYERLLELDPNNRSALVGLARLQHRRGSMDAAIAGYQRALRVAGNDPVILNDLGLCLARTGRTAEAIRTLQAALAAKPDSLLYRNNLAAVLVETKQIPLAVQTLAQTHGSAVAYYNVGYLLHQRGDVKGAYDHFTLALQADPSLGPARTMLDRIAPQIGQRPPVRAAASPGTPISATMTQPSGVAVPSGQQPVVQAMALVPAGATTDQPAGDVMRVQFEEPVAPISAIPRADAPATVGSSSAVPALRLPQRALRPQTGGAWIAPDPPSMPLAQLP
jgi:tetratricopeptide (TPR) repeat protein